MNKQDLDLDFMTETMCASALEVFSTMLGVEVQPSVPAQGAAVETEDRGVVALLGLTGDWKGSGGLCCSAECACWIASQMLFSEYPEVNDEVKDAVGEITNMIVGSFKNNIAIKTGPLGMSTPTVICGRDMKTTPSGANEWMVFPFKSDRHSFQMMVQLQPARQAAPRVHEQLHALV